MPADPLRQKQLFEQALELPPGERAAFLDGACAGDQELHARVSALLASLAAADDFLADPSPTPAGAQEQPGGVIDRYKLLQEIGEGGFGTVWMAEQLEPVRRKVALKVIKLGMDTRQVVARFEAERQALALMEHPNIAKVFDGGITPGGRPYFVMELIKGEPITEYCDQAELGTSERLELFQKVCHAVQHAHQRGVIHRDLKPSNILVTLYDGTPVPKVIDFGIAKATSSELTQKTLFTEFRQMVGTPEYMAPEQAELSGLDVDTRADVYSLGVVLYELLTGTKPFDMQSILEKGYLEMLRVIREDQPQKPSTRISTLNGQIAVVARHRHATPAALSRGLRGDLDWIVMKALEKERGLRYGTASEFAADIGRHLQDEPVHAGPPSAWYRLRKYVRRHRVGVVAGSIVALALIGGLAVATWGWLEADAQRVLAESEAERARTVLDFVEEMLGSADPKRVKGADYTLLEFLADFDQGLADRLGDQPDVSATLHALMATAYCGLREYGKAAPHGEAALENRRSALGPDHRLVAADLSNLGVIYAHLGRFEQAVSLEREALGIREQLPGDNREEVVASLWGLAGVLRSHGKLPEANDLLRRALDVTLERLGGDEANVAGAARENGELAQEKAIVREWRAALSRLFEDEDPAKAILLFNLSGIAAEEGLHTAAEEMLRESLKLSLLIYHDDHRSVAAVRNALALNLVRQKMSAKAEVLFQQVLATRRRILEQHNLLTWANFCDVASVQMDQRNFAKAESTCHDALKQYSLLGDTHPANMQMMELLYRALEGQGKFAEIVSMREERLAVTASNLPPVHLAIADELALIGLALMQQEEYSKAESVLRECLEIRKELEVSWQRYHSMSLLGEALVGQDKFDKAEQFLLDGYNKMRPPAEAAQHKTEALARLVELYESWGKEDEAAMWRAKLPEASAAKK